MSDQKNSLMPAAVLMLLWFYNTCWPSWWISQVFEGSGMKHTLTVSNVPGFVKPVYYSGGIVKRFFSLLSGPGNNACGINIVSVLKRAHICLTADESQIEDVPAFMSIFNRHIQKLGIKYDENEEGKD